MNFQKYILESSLTFNYEKIDNIVPKFFSDEYYQNLSKSFDEPNVIQLPPGLPDEIPVIVAKSKGKHSDLNISSVTTTLTTRYDNGYETDIKSSLADLKEKTYPIFNITENMLKKVDKKIMIYGLSFITELSVQGSDEPILNLIFDSLTRFEVDSNLDLKNDLADFNFKIALSRNDFYINITVGRSQNIDKKHMLAVIDINNKYALLKKRTHDINAESLNQLFDTALNAVNSIETILNGRLCLG